MVQHRDAKGAGQDSPGPPRGCTGNRCGSDAVAGIDTLRRRCGRIDTLSGGEHSLQRRRRERDDAEQQQCRRWPEWQHQPLFVPPPATARSRSRAPLRRSPRRGSRSGCKSTPTAAAATTTTTTTSTRHGGGSTQPNGQHLCLLQRSGGSCRGGELSDFSESDKSKTTHDGLVERGHHQQHWTGRGCLQRHFLLGSH